MTRRPHKCYIAIRKAAYQAWEQCFCEDKQLQLRLAAKKLRQQYPDLPNPWRFIRRAVHRYQCGDGSLSDLPRRGRPRHMDRISQSELSTCYQALMKGRKVNGVTRGFPWQAAVITKIPACRQVLGKYNLKPRALMTVLKSAFPSLKIIKERVKAALLPTTAAKRLRIAKERLQLLDVTPNLWDRIIMLDEHHFTLADILELWSSAGQSR